jgi:hypothetical protein
MKWVVEHSAEQNQYHIQPLFKRTAGFVNGWRLLAAFDTQDEAWEYLDKIKKEKTNG